MQADPSLHNLCFQSLKRTLDVFLANYGTPIPSHEPSQKKRLLVKLNDDYKLVKDMAAPAVKKPGKPGETKATTQASVEQMLDNIEADKLTTAAKTATALIAYKEKKPQANNNDGVGETGGRAIVPRKAVQFPKPQWHAPWKLMRVISGHTGSVRCVCVDPSNEWFATGAADRTIKVWDLASGQLRLTLTGHINTIRQVCISERHPYLFSVGEDKMVKCWDLEYNKVIRHYHGHLSGVYCATLHPTLDILVTGGRDSVARVWDMRTKAQIHVLAGHNNTVMCVNAQPTDPQIITGSMDTTVKLWDLAAGKTMCTLTNHKKAIRSMAMHPFEHTFVSGGADNIKKWKLPLGNFLQNLSGHRSIVNCMALNQDGVLFSGGDNGTMQFWDYRSGYCFQKDQTIVQPGSLASEAGIFASCFDRTGTRLISAEADKSIKIWREDELATPETHPVTWKPTTHVKRY